MPPPGPSRRSRARTVALVGGAAAGVAGLAGGAYAGVHAVRAGGRIASFAWRAATLQLHRRCPDCYSRIDGRARVCRHCGHRMRAAPR